MGRIGSNHIHSMEIDTTEDLDERRAKMSVVGDKVKYLHSFE